MGRQENTRRRIPTDNGENARAEAVVVHAELAPLRDGAIAVVSVHGYAGAQRANEWKLQTL
jgi:hypothetical protein